MLSKKILDSVQTSSQIRPILHQVKNLTPIICAIEKRESQSLPTIRLENALLKIDEVINTTMSDAGLLVPGEEWQRASFRNCIVLLAERDILEHGSICPTTWQEKISCTFRSISLAPGGAERIAKPALMVKLSIAENATRIISALSHQNIQNKHNITHQIVNRIFADAKHINTLIHVENPAEKASLMSGMINNYTTLMLSSINSHSGRFDFNQILQGYSEQQATILGLVEGSNELKTSPTKKPSFLAPGG